jgi:hypothetical protein
LKEADLIQFERYKTAYNTLDDLPLRGADCSTDHYLLIAKFGEILAVKKPANVCCREIEIGN